jgi:hypothetical protein
MIINPIKFLLSILVVALIGVSPVIAAAKELDQTLPIPVISSSALLLNYEALKGKIDETDRQRFEESLSYIESFVYSQKTLEESYKGKLLVLLFANRTPRQIILLGHLLYVSQLDKTLSGQINLGLDEGDDASKLKQAILREAVARKAFCVDVIEEYSKQ